MARPRHKASRLLLALLGAAFFFAPTVAFLAGERAKPIENRPLTKFPNLASGFGAFDELTLWGVDHLTLREAAVRLDSRLSRDILGEAPVIGGEAGLVGVGQAGHLAGGNAPPARPGAVKGNVVLGRDDWLYLGDEFNNACHPGRSSSGAIADARRFGSIVRRSGRRFVLVVAPDKSSVVPQFVPDGYALKDCSESARRRRLAALRAAAIPGFVDLQAALEREQRRQGTPIYLKGDTHWTDRGAVVLARAVAAAVDPRLLSGTTTVRGPDHQRAEDLAFQLGDPFPRSQPRFDVARRGVATKRLPATPAFPGGEVVHARARPAPGGAPVYDPPTLVHGDSYTERSLEQLTPFFADFTMFPVLTNVTPGDLPAAESRLINQIRRARLVVFIKAERGFWFREPGSVLDDRFLDTLEKAL